MAVAVSNEVPWFLDAEDAMLVPKLLGRGAFGVIVQLNSRSHKGSSVALKMCALGDAFLREVRIMEWATRTFLDGKRAPMFLRKLHASISQGAIPQRSPPWDIVWVPQCREVWKNIEEKWEETRTLTQRRRVSMWAYANTKLSQKVCPNRTLDLTLGAPLCTIVSECATGGTLQKMLNARGKKLINAEGVRAISAQLMFALASLHVEGMQHRDIHAENVVLRLPSLSGPSAVLRIDGSFFDAHAPLNGKTVCLVDFGSAPWPPAPHDNAFSLDKPVTMLLHRDPAMLFFGMPCISTPQSDMWGLGILLLQAGLAAAMPDAQWTRTWNNECIRHPLFTPENYGIMHVPRVPESLVYDIGQLHTMGGGTMQWGFIECYDGARMIALYMWNMLFALGEPKVNAWPQLERSALYALVRKHYHVWLGEQDGPKSKISPWVWSHGGLAAIMGRSGMEVLWALLQWSPERRPRSLGEVLKVHAYFAPLRVEAPSAGADIWGWDTPRDA